MKSLLFASMLAIAGAAQAHLTIFAGSFAPEATGATGSGTLRLAHDEHDNTLFIQEDWEGLSGATTNAHIHCCTAIPLTGTAGVALAESGRLPGFAAGITNAYTRIIDLALTSMYSGTFVTASGGTANGARDRLLANLASGQASFNIHTTTFGGGEIRAFVTQAPEPQTHAMLIAGLGVLGWAARRKQTQDGEQAPGGPQRVRVFRACPSGAPKRARWRRNAQPSRGRWRALATTSGGVLAR